jgi:hypothetical protein
MASVTGSRLAFFSSTVTADKVNVVLTTDGTTVGAPIAGDFNIEVFTSTPGALAAGFQASAFIQGAQQISNNVVQAALVSSTEQFLQGSYTVIDLSGGSAQGEALQIVGTKGDALALFGSAGDTITGSTNAGVSQFIDISGTNPSALPGPFQGPETVIGGAGATNVFGGKGDMVNGGAGALQFNDVNGTTTVGGGNTVLGGTGNVSVFSIGANESITGSTVGTTFINDQYGKGGNSNITGGSGSGIIFGAANTIIFAEKTDKVTVGSGTSFVDASRGSITVVGGAGTAPGAFGSGFNTVLVAGKNDQLTLGSGQTFVAEFPGLPGTGSTVTGGAGLDVVVAGGTGMLITGGKGDLVAVLSGGAGTVAGGAGNLIAVASGAPEAITGSTGATTIIDASGAGASTLTGGTGTGSFTVDFGTLGKAAINTELVGGVGTTMTGAGTVNTYLNAISGKEQVNVGGGATTVQAATGDTIGGGAGTMLAILDSSAASTTLNLGATHGVATLRDNSVTGGKGDAVSVTGFATATDVVASATSVSATNTFLGTSKSDGAGGTILSFLDGSTMTLALVADPTKIKFTQ